MVFRHRMRRAALLTSCMLALMPAGVLAQDGKPEEKKPVALDPINVRGTAGEAEATTEGSNSYATRAATIGSKDETPLRQIPQSVSVVTRQRMDDQNMTQLEDAMRRTTGMLVLANDPGRSSLFTRGFELDNLLVDGLPAPVSSIYGTQPDLFIYDRVEILRGPAGLFGGTSEPGGTVNLARKRALGHFATNASLGYGSWDNYRGEADLTGPLSADGRIRGRVAAAYQNRDTFVDVTHNEVAVGYGTLEFDFTPQMTLSIGLRRQDRDITPFNGLPSFTDGRLLDVKRSTFIGADWNRFDNQSMESFAEFEHRFDGGGHAKVAVRYVDREVDFKYAFAATAVNPAVGTTTLTALARRYDEETFSSDAHVSLPFTIAGLTQNVTLGLDYRRYEQTTLQGTANGFTGAVNVYAPVSAVAEPAIGFTTRTKADPEQIGAYAQAKVKPWQPLTLVLGGRLAWYDSTATNLVTGAKTETDIDAEVTPYAAVVGDITDQISVYVSYAEIFQPQTNLTAAGTVIAPRTGRQYEAGVKGEFFGGALNTHAALFNLRDQDRALADPGAPGSFIAAGKVEVEGFEAEVSGRLLPGLEVFAGYAYTDTKIITAAAAVGTPFSTFTPKHVFNLWTRYEFEDGPLKGLSIGGGGRIHSSFYNLSGAARLEENGYIVVDAQIGYRITENLKATLSVNNVFDETYYQRVGGTTVFNFYGEPRSFFLKLSANL